MFGLPTLKNKKEIISRLIIKTKLKGKGKN